MQNISKSVKAAFLRDGHHINLPQVVLIEQRLKELRLPEGDHEEDAGVCQHAMNLEGLCQHATILKATWDC